LIAFLGKGRVLYSNPEVHYEVRPAVPSLLSSLHRREALDCRRLLTPKRHYRVLGGRPHWPRSSEDLSGRVVLLLAIPEKFADILLDLAQEETL
jgi:hypothetical protein